MYLPFIQHENPETWCNAEDLIKYRQQHDMCYYNKIEQMQHIKDVKAKTTTFIIMIIFS